MYMYIYIYLHLTLLFLTIVYNPDRHLSVYLEIHTQVHLVTEEAHM